MGKLSPKLRKNENNIISLIRLHENILKYFLLDLFKELAIRFSHVFQTTSQSPVSLFDGLLA